MKKKLVPNFDEIVDIPNFRETHAHEIKKIADMLSKRGKELWAQIRLANELREEQVGDYVTFVVNQNINFTRYCIGTCKFCSYRVTGNRDSNPSIGFSMSLEELKQEVEKAVSRGCTEVCIQGGLDPKLNYDFYIGILRTVRSVSSSIHIHAFSPAEIAYMSVLSEETVEDVFKDLKLHGLDSFPGTAAEILVDDVRKIICPDKLSTKEWVNIVITGHLVGLPSTSTMMYGHIENYQDEAEHLMIIRYIQEYSKGFTEFVPLPFVHKNTPLYLHYNAQPSSTGFHDLALFSTSRIFLGDVIPNLQASWVKLGPKFAQISLEAGVNDLGGTLFSEKISRSAGSNFGELMSKKEFLTIVRDCHRIPVERDTLYNHLRKY